MKSTRYPGCLALLMGALLIWGCGRKTPEPEVPGPGGENVSKGAPVELEVAVFEGGYGLDFFRARAEEFAQKKGLTLHFWGNPRVWEQLRPRFVQGDVPDLSWPGWDMDTWSLVYEGQVQAMDEYLETPAWDQDKPWKETFMPSLLERGKYQGHYYILPFNYNAFGWWYNVKMFQTHGWKPPRTWEELLTLGEKIKAAGIAPLTFQGKYPDYMLRGFFLPWAISVGGLEAYAAAQNLEPGAWAAEPFLKAAEMIAELVRRDFFLKGSIGLDHTASQMEFIEGRAAMIPCGTWLYSEMKKQMPKGFVMDFILPPVVSGGKGDPTLVHAAPETWIVPAKAKHPELGAELYKYMTSLENAKKFVAEKHTLMSIIGSDAGELPPNLKSPARIMREAKGIWHADHSEWYRAMNKELESALAALLTGEVTPAECVARMEKAATKAREDERLPKHRVTYETKTGKRGN